MKDVLQGSVPLPSPKRDALAQQAAYYSSFTPHLPPTFDSPIPEAPSSYSSLAQDRTSHLHPILTLIQDSREGRQDQNCFSPLPLSRVIFPPLQSVAMMGRQWLGQAYSRAIKAAGPWDPPAASC
jgi:hypothetical protein